MKKLIILLILISGISCKKDNPQTKIHTQPIPNFDWLVGNWIRKNEKEDRKTYENWAKKSDSEYNGSSFTIKNNDTIWQENVILSKSGDTWNFAVTGKGESKPVLFRLTKIEPGSFTCANEKNEFPKRIQYYKNGDKFNAVISGGDMKIPFEFERIPQK